MADKTDLHKNFNYYYKKFSKELPDIKYFYWLTESPEHKDDVFYDEKTFFTFMLGKVTDRASSMAGYLTSISSQPSSYGAMLAYKCLKEKNKLETAMTLADKYIILAFSLSNNFRLRDSYDRAAMISAYNEAIKTLLTLEKESSEIFDEVVDGLKNAKSSKNKDVYIG